MMSGSNSRAELNNDSADWEMRPGGMLVQKRDDAAGPAGPPIKIKICHGSSHLDVAVPAQSTFGELKRVLARETGLEPEEQRLLFRGKEKDNDECLHMAGVKDASKVVLLEDPASRERKLERTKRDQERTKRDQGIARACQAVGRVGTEVDKLADRVSALEAAVNGGTKVAEKEFDVSTELLMTQLLKLDGIEAEGEAKVQRKSEVRRIQKFVDALDALKARNSNPFNGSTIGNSSARNSNPFNGSTIGNSSAVSVTTQWETFESGMGSLNAPPPMPSSTKKTNDWEQFD